MLERITWKSSRKETTVRVRPTKRGILWWHTGYNDDGCNMHSTPTDGKHRKKEKAAFIDVEKALF